MQRNPPLGRNNRGDESGEDVPGGVINFLLVAFPHPNKRGLGLLRGDVGGLG